MPTLISVVLVLVLIGLPCCCSVLFLALFVDCTCEGLRVWTLGRCAALGPWPYGTCWPGKAVSLPCRNGGYRTKLSCNQWVTYGMLSTQD